MARWPIFQPENGNKAPYGTTLSVSHPHASLSSKVENANDYAEKFPFFLISTALEKR